MYIFVCKWLYIFYLKVIKKLHFNNLTKLIKFIPIKILDKLS